MPTKKQAPSNKRTYIIPRRGPRLTFLAAGYGLLLLFWLGGEDSTLWPVTILGWGSALLISGLAIIRGKAGQHLTQRQMIIGTAIWGGLSGLLSAPLTVFLMLFKTALHGHANPDYAIAVMGAMLARTPAWSLAGMLLGLGGGLLLYAERHRKNQQKQP